MKDFAELIQRIGVHRFAAICGLDVEHARVIRGRNSVPYAYWGPLIDECRRLRISHINWQLLEGWRAKALANPAKTGRRKGRAA